MSRAERGVRQWMDDNCPSILMRLEELQAVRSARLASMGHGYFDRDLEEQERALWALAARVPGWQEMVGVMAVMEEEEKE